MSDPIPTGPHAYTDPGAHYHHAYVLPAVLKARSGQEGKRLLDLGSGNGYIANELQRAGYDVTGVEPSPESIKTRQLSQRQICPRQRLRRSCCTTRSVSRRREHRCNRTHVCAASLHENRESAARARWDAYTVNPISWILEKSCHCAR